jgi:hypothetical protein
MSRLFDGQFTVASVTFSAGSATFSQGPCTVMALVRFAASASGALCYVVKGANAGGSDVWALQAFSLNLFTANDFTSGSAALSTDNYYWAGFSHTSGGTPRWHLRNVQSAGAWSHADASGTVGDGSGPVTSIIVGNSSAAGSDDMRGEIAAIAVWGSALSDGAVQSACTLNASDLVTSSPAWGTLWNQASTGTSVTDFTGGSGNQTAISATSVGTDEPPGWSYSLSSSFTAGPPVVIGQAVNRSYTY